MNPSIQDGILATYHNSLSWDQSFSILHNDQPVDLSTALGQPNSSTFSAPDQPKKNPNGLIYRFDIAKFTGELGWSSLKKMIKDSLPGSGFIECRPFRALSLNSFHYTLHCNKYKMLEINNTKHYHPEFFTQSGVHIESVKRTKTPGELKAFDAMASKMELRAMKNDTITTSSKVHRKKEKLSRKMSNSITTHSITFSKVQLSDICASVESWVFLP